MAATQSSSSKHNILLVTGGGWHDFAAGAMILRKTLEDSGRFIVVDAKRPDVAAGVPEFANLSNDKFAAVLIYTQGGNLSKEEEDGLVKFVENGGGLVGIHCANDSFTKNDRYMKLLGSQFVTHPPGVFEFNVAFTPAAKTSGNPIAARSNDFLVTDEHYIVKQHSDYELFAISHLQGKDHPMGYTRTQGKGKVVYLANGHWPASLSNRFFQRVLERSLRWASGEDMAVKKTVNVGIIGYGAAFNMGKAHSESINAQLGMKVVGVCDLSTKQTDQAKKDFPDIKTSNNTEQFLADPSIDMVVLIVPHNVHASTSIAASKAGKHVVTEKPFCITIEEADGMIAAAASAGKMLSCFHNRRWDIDFTRILDIARSGEIGQLFHVEAASSGYGMPGTWWRASKEISGGVLYDWGAHYCDWVLNLMPKRIESVSGNVQKRYWHMSTNEDFAQAHIRFEDGTTANIEQGNLAAIGRPGWRILGTLGAMSNGGPHQEITKVTIANGVRTESKVPAGGMVWHNYYQNIGNHLHLNERLIVTAQQARRAIGVLRLAELSSKEGGKPLPLPGEKEYTPDYVIPW